MPFLSNISFIVLNFMILKGLLLSPGLSCKKKIFPLLATKRKIAVIKIIGEKIIKRKNETKKSPKGFKKCLYIY